MNIEKRHYHDEVFNKCVEYLDYNVEYTSASFLNLKRMLKDASFFVSNFERDFLKSLNIKNFSEMITSVVRIVDRLFRYFSSYDSWHRGYFSKTFDYIYRIADLYDFESRNDVSYFNRFVDSYYPVAAPREKKIRKLTANNSTRIFYKIIESIVVDINNQDDAWDFIRKQYTSKYILPIKQNDKVFFTEQVEHNAIITFLSYSFEDKAYSLFLFHEFINNGGFLYVDSLFSKPLNSGSLIKESLNVWINNSKQFLFLRSAKSEQSGIRQWCSWEIGKAYETCNSFFFVDVVGVGATKNPLLDDFEEFNYVSNGVIY